jgi:hypothetical protein
MSPLDSHVLNIGAASLAHPQTVQPEQYGERAAGVVEPLRG